MDCSKNDYVHHECNICMDESIGHVGIKHNYTDIICPFEACAVCANKLQDMNLTNRTRCTCGVVHDLKLNFIPKKITKISKLPIICMHCNASCKDDVSYREHIFRSCRKTSHVCTNCNMKIVGISLDNHEKRQCDYQYPCKKCGIYILHRDRVKHGKIYCFPVKCTKSGCRRSFRLKWDLEKHIEKDHSIKCSCCDIYHKYDTSLAQCTKCENKYCPDKFAGHTCI